MILVVGATGDLGGRVVAVLRERGEQVRALVRSGTDGSRLSAIGAELVIGDLTEPASLRSACAGVDAVVATATMMSRRLAGQRHPTMREVDEIGAENLVAAAESAGVEHFVYASATGVDVGIDIPLVRAKLATERRLAVSPMKTSIVRPDGFQDMHLTPVARFDAAAGRISIIGAGNTPRRFIAIDDVATLFATLAQEPAQTRLLTVGGPEPMTLNMAADLAERLSGHPIKRQHLPRTVARLLIKAAKRRNPALASAIGFGLIGDLQPADWDDAPLRDRGITPRSVTQFLTAQLGGASALQS